MSLDYTDREIIKHVRYWLQTHEITLDGRLKLARDWGCSVGEIDAAIEYLTDVAWKGHRS